MSREVTEADNREMAQESARTELMNDIKHHMVSAGYLWEVGDDEIVINKDPMKVTLKVE